MAPAFRPFVRLLTLLVAVALGGVVPVHAQTTGSIHGVVVDTEGGAPIEQVSVRLQGVGTVATTDAEGRFAFDAVAPGPHELYVSVVNFLLVTRRVDVMAGAPTELTIALTQGTGTYTETVSVVGASGAASGSEATAELRVRGLELQQLSGLLANDPMRAVQALPGVATGDDFRSEFSVRGAGPSQTGFILEGISTEFLLHTVQQVNGSGSIAMVNGEVLDSVALRSGSYPGRYGNRTGAEVEFQMREGSRDRVRAHASVSAVDASGVAEGPIGTSHRRSWLVSARKSYLDLILKRMYEDQSLSFGFTDVQSKLAWHVSDRNQVTLSTTAGRSKLDLVPDTVSNPNDLRFAVNQSALGVLAWRFTPVATFTLNQKLAVIANHFENTSRDGPILDDGDTRDVVYRAEWTRPVGKRVTFEGGAEARWTQASGHEQRVVAGRLVTRESFDRASTRTGAFVSARLTLGRATIAPGARIDRWSLIDEEAASPWAQATLPVSDRLTLKAGAGVYRQAPDTSQVWGARGTRTLGAARATGADLGLEGRLRANVRWQVTAYNREDRHQFRLLGTELRLVNNIIVNTSLVPPWRNALDGHARGVEWQIERHAERGISGWISYALGSARYRDPLLGETFWGDFDQRHTLNAFGTYRLSDRTSMSARFRLGSNMPAPGYWREQGGLFYLTNTRNNVRVPDYSRLDLRANRTFTRSRGRATLYVEVLNVLARDNKRFQSPSVNRRTLEATNLFETLLPVVPSAGLLFEF